MQLFFQVSLITALRLCNYFFKKNIFTKIYTGTLMIYVNSQDNLEDRYLC